MERMRTRRPSMSMKPTAATTANGPTYENFQATAEWSQDSANNNLLIHLPGFKREEISVQLDNNSGKIMVRGTRKVTDDKFFRLDQSFDVPENTIVEKISGRLENGYLTMILPFRKPNIDPEKTTAVVETIKSDEDDYMRKKLESGEKKLDEAPEKETPKGIDEDDSKKKSESIEEKVDEKRHEDGIQKKEENTEEKKDEPIKEETAKVSDEASGNRDEFDTVREQKKEHDADIGMEKKKKKKEEFALNEMATGISEMAKRAEGVMVKISKKAKLGSRKRGPIWRDGNRLIDDLLEKVNRNKKVIAVVFVALSVGLYVSKKMKTNGR